MAKNYGGSAAMSFGFERRGLPAVEAVSAVARRLWPVKTARQLASRAGTTHRAAEFWLSQQTGMSADALAELLRSDAGLEVLQALIGTAPPSWWPDFRQDAKAAGIERRLNDLRAEIDEVKRGSR
jgi:hypothetical protein